MLVSDISEVNSMVRCLLRMSMNCCSLSVPWVHVIKISSTLFTNFGSNEPINKGKYVLYKKTST